jgi:hypothetical protein
VLRPVRALMGKRGVEALGVPEGLDRRHLDAVRTRRVEGSISVCSEWAVRQCVRCLDR